MTGLSRRVYIGVAALAAATLLLEGTLLRLLAVAQFYHFAFLVVSLALLGFGASGTLLSVSIRLQRMPLRTLLPWTGLAFACSVAVSYAAVNWLPFDSYSIAWQRSQILYFVAYYVALTLPFVCGGLGIGAAIAAGGDRSHIVYAANLGGSALGSLLALGMLRLAGVPGSLMAAAAVALVPAWSGRLRWPAIGASLVLIAGFMWYSTLNWAAQAPLGFATSPYKGLAYARQYPGSQRIFGAWNEIARVDVMQNAGTRQLPGLSYSFAGNPPSQYGMALDAGAVLPITLAGPDDFDAAAYMPEAFAYALRPDAHALVLESGGGLAVLQALAGGAQQVTAVGANALERRAASTAGEYDVFTHPQVESVQEMGRVYLKRAMAEDQGYDVIVLPLTDPYQPVASGAYSLAETYLLTEEAFSDMLARLDGDGILVATRWLQTPPSESVKLLATLSAALRRAGVDDPSRHLVMVRGIQTATAFAKLDGWTENELTQLRTFAADRRFDLVWAPDIVPHEVNRFNRMPEPLYYQAALSLMQGDSATFIRDYPFAIAPAIDDRPFFFHFFTWAQTPEVLATVGRTWQPFGGSGYFILFAMLALVILLSAVFIVLPLTLRAGGRQSGERSAPVRLWRVMAYFGLIGLAFLFVEIPLIQQWMLLVGHPVYAFTGVVLALLLFSSAGSLLSRRAWANNPLAFAALIVFAIVTPFATARYVDGALNWPMGARVVGAMLLLAPLALFMGMPFPRGLSWLEGSASWIRPWAWAVNGCASVVSGVVAAILALSYGFTVVLLIGAACYAAAWATVPRLPSSATRNSQTPTLA